MKLFLYSLLLGVMLSLQACDSEPQARQAKFYAFATEIDVSLFGVDAETANSTVEVLEQSFSNVNNTWHAWQPSTLMQINSAIAAGEAIPVTGDVASLITLAQDIAKKSDHLFNPAAGKLFELWGYHGDAWFESRPPPAQSDIDAWLTSMPTMEAISITDNVLTSTNSMVKIGFGAFAKGYAVDSAINALKGQGIENAIVNIGGDLRAIGSHGKRPWIIGIRHPRQDGMLGSLALKGDESVFTSGDYERFFEYQGKRYPHILDPRTGYPADQAISATVLHTNASEADAAATALFVAGNGWPHIAKQLGIDYVMLVKPDGQIEMSPKMAERMRLIDLQKPAIIRNIE
jgi:thiamine biosynthesis lipoprotein